MKVVLQTDRFAFGRNLSKSELKEYSQVLKEGKSLAGQTGKSIFIMPSSCLPQSETFNSGIGSISSKYAQDYFQYMKNYLGFNVVEDLPAGQVNCGKSGLYCAYNASSFALGNQQINPELLATEQFANLLTQKDLKDIADGNTGERKELFANFKNVMAHTGKQNEVLKRAYERFKKLPGNHFLKQRFNTYIKENDYWLWIQEQYEPDREYFKFKQFLADEHLKIGKQQLNEKGIKLFGDCLIGFNWDEYGKNLKAFKTDHFIGIPEWGLPALNYDEILDESSEASKLLKAKIQLFAKRYDGIRFDVGWAYVTPLVTPKGTGVVKDENKKYLGDALLKNIEKWVKEIKGEDFDLHNLIYEFDAGPEEFSAFGNDGKLIQPLRGRVKIFGSTHMHDTNGDCWGYNDAYLNRGFSPDEFVLGIGNHDPQPLRQIAKNIPEKFRSKPDEYHKEPAIKPLSKILKIAEEVLADPVEFARAKWAEPMFAKNTQMFFMDVFGREERFDMQDFNTTVHPENNYAYKVPSDYKAAYMRALKEGFGFNPMDALEKVFVARGLDKSNPELFDKIVKFKNILLEDEPAIVIKDTIKTDNCDSAAKNSVKIKLPAKIALLTAGIGILSFAGYKLLKSNNKLKRNNT